MLIDGRKFETSNAQASGMEEKIKDVQLNQVEEKPTTPKCYNCGFAYPHPDHPCPAENSTCISCGILGEFARVLVRSLSGKNWQDLYKADKVSISFPATPKSN